MYISKKLLIEINPIFKTINDKDFEHLCNRLGIEIESVAHHHSMGNLQIAYLEEVVKHPNAEKLNVAQVRLNKDKVVTVVCGAANIKPKVFAIYAPIGTKFLDGRVIDNKNIRGVDSFGMLCGYSELTTIGCEMLSAEDADGIILLDQAKLGDTHIEDYIDNDDTIYDLSIPSNRNDLNAAVLLAHELLVGLKLDSHLPLQINQLKPAIKVPTIDKKLASAFGLIYIPKAFAYKPNWKEKQLLMSSGYKVHDNLLDLMNLFTIRYGNPTHVYNADQLKPENITIKQTTAEMSIIALDNLEYSIPKNTIGVFHKDQLINIAGIFGLNESKYLNDSQSVIIEVANFTPKLIKQTAQATKIQTKAQAFFGKEYSTWITQMTYLKICEFLTHQKIDFDCYYAFPKLEAPSIKLDLEAAKQFIGLKELAVTGYYGFKQDSYTPHPTRIDIKNVYDVYEEIMKFIDINKLSLQPIEFKLNNFNLNKTYYGLNKLRNYLTNYGLMEVKTYNLCSEENENKFNFFNLSHSFKLANPISKNREVLRKSLVDELLKVLQYNLARKRELYNIFEIQTIVESEKQSTNNLAMLFAIPIIDNQISNAMIELNLLNLKGFVSNLFATLNQTVEFKQAPDLKLLEIYAEQTFSISINQITIGYLSVIKSSILKIYNILQPVFTVNLKIDPSWFDTPLNTMQTISSFPTVYRDVNLKTNDLKQVNLYVQKIKQVPLVKECWINNVYTKDSLTTYTMTIKINDLEKTMTDEAIKKVLIEIDHLINA